MRIVLLTAVALAAAAPLAGCGSATRHGGPRSHPPRPSGQPEFLPIPAAAARQSFGINAQFLFTLLPSSLWELHAQGMRRAGIQIVRTDAPWGSAEPAPPGGAGHHYGWAYFDSIAATLASAGLRWLPIIDFSAPWDGSFSSGGSDPKLSPPRNPALFVDYARAFVLRYGPDGSFWRLRPDLPDLPVQAIEVWNEEDLETFWKPAPDPAGYLRLYEATRAAVHRLRPDVEVIVGGLAEPAVDFLNRLYRAGGERVGLFDAVAVHPYASSDRAVIDNVIRERAFLDSHGDIDVPLDVTEVGWPTSGTASSDAPVLTDLQRASALSTVTTTLARSDCGVERILPHTWVTLERNPDNPGDWFGLVHPNGTPSATAIAFASTIEAFERQPSAAATESVCHRPLTVTASPLPRGCMMATVTSEGSPVDAATVQFIPPGKPAVTTRTNRSGLTVGCAGSTNAAGGTLQVRASRADFAEQGLGYVRLP